MISGPSAYAITTYACNRFAKYCFLGIFSFSNIKFCASKFILLILINLNHTILKESNKHANVESKVRHCCEI